MTIAATYVVGDTEVARIGLGTNRLTKTREHVALIRGAVAAGVQLIDTAHLYVGGYSEETIGEALSPFPDDCVVATKGGFHGAAPDVLRAELEESLHRLRTDVIPLYYLHRIDPETPLEESLAVIREYRERGAIRLVGISQATVEQVERARTVVPIAAVQNHYNLAERSNEAVVDYCEREGIAFVPYFPLRASGGSELKEIARRHRASEMQIALAWLLRRSPAMVPIPGSLSLEHVKENLGALQVELTDAEFDALR